MFENELNPRPVLHPALSVFFIIILAGFGFIVGGFVPVLIYMETFDGTQQQFMDALQNINDHPEMVPVLFAAQIGATLGGLILAPIIFLRTQRLSIVSYFRSYPLPLSIFLLAGLIVVVSFGINSLLMEWNQSLVFPEFLKDFEQWARLRETEAQEQTVALTKMDTVGDLLVGLLVIAVLPAIGEEFVFRGIIQNELNRGTNNIHVAIWFTAILFSAFHLQFFGFVPRTILGALFGYFYFWSGNLWIAIVAHFINNAAQVIALYFYQRGAFEFDLENPGSIPYSVVVSSAVLTAALLYLFYRYFQTNRHFQSS